MELVVTDTNLVRALFGNLAPLATTCAGPCYGLSANAAWAAHCPNCPHTEAARLDLPVKAFGRHSEEYEFALDGMREHWQGGLDGMRCTQADPCRLDRPPPEFGALSVLAEALAELPDNQREAVVLRHWHDCSLAEIAERLGCTTAAVTGLLHRGLRNLRQLLQDLE